MDPKKLAEDILDELFPQQEVVNEEADEEDEEEVEEEEGEEEEGEEEMLLLSLPNAQEYTDSFT
jgi:hypothetical protein